MFFPKKIFVSYVSGNKNFKLRIEDRFKKESPKDKLNVWPNGYNRFSMPEKSEETYYVKPKKFNYKIILFSIVVVILAWLIGLRPIEKKEIKTVNKDNSVKVLILHNSDIENYNP